MTDQQQCGWTLHLVPKGRKTPEVIVCTEDEGHADGMHSGDGWSWLQLPQQSIVDPDTELPLP